MIGAKTKISSVKFFSTCKCSKFKSKNIKKLIQNNFLPYQAKNRAISFNNINKKRFKIFFCLQKKLNKKINGLEIIILPHTRIILLVAQI